MRHNSQSVPMVIPNKQGQDYKGKKRIASGIGHINTRGFSLANNALSSSRVSFVLRDFKQLEAFN